MAGKSLLKLTNGEDVSALVEFLKSVKDIENLTSSFEKKGLFIHPFGSRLLEDDVPSSSMPGLGTSVLDRSKITVTSINDTIVRLEFEVMEVATGLIETRITWDGIQTRKRFRKLKARIDVDRNSFVNLPGFTGLTSNDLADAVIAFVLCALGLTIVTAAVAAAIVAGGITLSALLLIFELAVTFCSAVIAGVATATALGALRGDTSTTERWGAWG